VVTGVLDWYEVPSTFHVAITAPGQFPFVIVSPLWQEEMIASEQHRSERTIVLVSLFMIVVFCLKFDLAKLASAIFVAERKHLRRDNIPTLVTSK
jgi:hypothetical protein